MRAVVGLQGVIFHIAKLFFFLLFFKIPEGNGLHAGLTAQNGGFMFHIWT